DYSQKINKKMYWGAMRSIFSQLLRDDRLKVVDDLVIKKPKTKEFMQVVSKLGLVKPLIIVDKFDDNLLLASRNLPHTTVVQVTSIDPVTLLAHEHILLTKAALVKLNEVLENA